jgi:hypothetical protein
MKDVIAKTHKPPATNRRVDIQLHREKMGNLSHPIFSADRPNLKPEAAGRVSSLD